MWNGHVILLRKKIFFVTNLKYQSKHLGMSRFFASFVRESREWEMRQSIHNQKINIQL